MSRVNRLPQSILADEGVGEGDELSHDGGEGDFGLLSVAEKAYVEGLQVGIEAGCGEGGHVDAGAQAGAPAPDVALAPDVAAVARNRGQASDHGSLFARARAELGEVRQQGDSGDVADAWDRGEDGKAPGERRVGLDDALDLGLQPSTARSTVLS